MMKIKWNFFSLKSKLDKDAGGLGSIKNEQAEFTKNGDEKM